MTTPDTPVPKPVYNLLNVTDVQRTFNEMLVNSQHTRAFRVIPFDGSNTMDVQKFIEDYESLANDLKWSDEDKLNKLKLYLKDNAKEWLKLVTKDPKVKHTWQTVKEQLEKYFMPIDYQDHLREQLRERKQGSNEPVSLYILDKTVLCNKLNSEMDPKEIMDHLYTGLKGEICSRLYSQSPRSVNDFVEKAKLIEHGLSKEARTVNNELNEIRSEMRELVSTMASAFKDFSNNKNISGHYRHPSRQRPNSYRNGPQQRTFDNNPICWNCSQPGHTRMNCPVTQVYPPRNHHSTFQQNSAPFTNQPSFNQPQPSFGQQPSSNNTTEEIPREPQLIVVPGTLNEHPALCMIDSGSTVSMVSSEFARSLAIAQPYNGRAVRAVNGKNVSILGKTSAAIKIKGINDAIMVTLLITDHLAYNCLLGNDFNQRARLVIDCGELTVKPHDVSAHTTLRESEIDQEIIIDDELDLGLVPLDLEHESNHNVCCSIQLEDFSTQLNLGDDLSKGETIELMEVLNSFNHILVNDYNKLGKCGVFMHQIDTENHPPISSPPYRYSLPIREFIKEEVQKMEDLQVIRRSNSPYSSPVVVVGKKDNTKRICVDLRKLNAITKKDVYPIPIIDDLLSTLVGAKYFSTLDLNAGYWQILMNPPDIEKTAFRTQDGFYEFLRMPFGLCNAPATFQRTMDVVLAGLKHRECLVYLDDIVVFGSSCSEMTMRLKNVLEALANAGLTLEVGKCKFGITKINFLGHVIDGDGIHTDPEKIDKIKAFPTPRSVSEVRSFVGAAGYYRKFILNFSVIARPLTQLTRLNVQFSWNVETDRAFQTLKAKLFQAPILCHFNPKLPIELHCDASKTGIGGALMHCKDNQATLVWVVSRLLTDTERRYPITEQEALSVVWCLKKLRTFLLGIRFTIYTDHKALCWLMNKKDLSDRLTRWALTIQEYNFDIVYKPGVLHHVPDYLSRYPEATFGSDNDEKDFKEHCVNLITASGSIFGNKQRRDHNLNRIITAILNPEDHQNIDTSGYVIEEDTLFKLIESESGPKLVPCIPNGLIDEVLYTMHDDPISGHLGIQKTLDKVQSNYYWHGMTTDVKTYVKSCRDCQGRKRECKREAGLLCPLEVGGPFERVGMDLLGRFPRSTSGNTYIIVATDYLTRWAECKALKDGSSESIANFVAENIICRYGSPNVFLTDRGKAFQSQFIEELYKLFHSKHVRTSAYHPATNGLTERFNKTLATMLSMYVNSQHDDWDRALPFVTLAYNTCRQSSTQYSPFFLLHGYEAKLPNFLASDLNTLGLPAVQEYQALMSTFLEQKREVAKHNIGLAQVANKQEYDRRHRQVIFNDGDKVLVYVPQRKRGKAEKLLHFFRGPYIVKERRGINSYLVYLANGPETKTDIVHVSQMKPYCERTQRRRSDSDSTVESLVFQESDEPYQEESDEPQPEEVVEPQQEETDALQPEESDSLFNRLMDNVPLLPDVTDRPAASINHTPPPQSPIREVEESDSQPEEHIPEPVRRSLRTRRPPNRLTYSIMTIFIWTLCFALAFGSLQKVHPVVWRKSPQSVVKGFLEIEVKVKFDHPCIAFLTAMNATDLETGYIQRWCNWNMKSGFEEPLSSMCETNSEQPPRRRRSVTLAALGVVSILATFSLGLGAVSLDEALKNKHEIDRVRRLLAMEMGEVEKIRKSLLHVSEATTSAINELQRLTDEIGNLQKHKFELNKKIPYAAHTISILTHRVMTSRLLMQQVEEEWEKDHLSFAFSELFNITMPCQKNCDISTARNLKCHYDKKASLATFSFTLAEASQHFTVLEADPFNFFTHDSSTGDFCRLTYTGAKNVMFNENTKCIAPLPLHYNSHHQNLILSPEALTCSNNEYYNTTTSWQQHDCTFRKYITETDVIQIKSVDTNNFVYCNMFNISIYNRTVRCPDYPFSINVKQSFTIGPLTYNYKQSQVVTKWDVEPGIVERINFAFSPDIHHFNFTETLNKLKQDRLNILRVPPRMFLIDYDIPWWMIFVGILMIFGLAYVLLKRLVQCWKNTRDTTERVLNESSNTHNSNLIEMVPRDPEATNSRPILFL